MPSRDDEVGQAKRLKFFSSSGIQFLQHIERPVRHLRRQSPNPTCPMPRLSLVSSSSVAVCLRCQFRYSHRLQALRRARPPPLRPNYKSTFFTTTSLYRADNRELIVLEPPGPRQSFHRYGPSHEPQALDDSNLDSGARELLTYEFRSDNPSALDATQMEISLYKPHIVRVSRERYQQLFQELDRAFLKPQLMEYFSRSTPIKPGIKKRREVVVSKKRDILDEILRSRWGIEVTDEIAEREDVLVSKEIMSNRRDIFFMIGEGMHIAPRFLGRSMGGYLRFEVV